MSLLREIRKSVGGFFADPRLLEIIESQKKEIDFLYRFLEIPKGERQYATRIEDVRKDHLCRYEFANKFVRNGCNVLDIACGIGYGSWLIANNNEVQVTGIDISKQAIKIAELFWSHDKINYSVENCIKTKQANHSFDVIVSFETIEHIQDYSTYLQHLKTLIKPKGTIICSTPNEGVWPLAKSNNPHHFKHFTSDEMQSLLKNLGFSEIEVYSQINGSNPDVLKGNAGKYLIFKAIGPV